MIENVLIKKPYSSKIVRLLATALAREQVALLPGRCILRMAMAQRRRDDLLDGIG
jgi:hypothetical protein